MVFNRFHWQIILRLLFLLINCYAITFFFAKDSYWITFGNLVLFLVLQVIFLFKYLTRWHKDLKIFTESVRHGDFTITYQLDDRKNDYYELYKMLNEVTAFVRHVKSAYVQQNHYFKYVVENAQVGLLAYTPSGDVVLSNGEARKLLKCDLKSINELKQQDKSFYNELISLPLNQPKLINNKLSNVKLSVRRSEFVIDEQPVFLLSLMNIRLELEENEMQSWQDLISVLTHEIMNSITPIHSLNGSMTKYLNKIEGNEEIVTKAKNSLEVINRRSASLMNFVAQYRKISTVPLPNLQLVKVGNLLSAVTSLLREELKDIEIEINHQDDEIYVDFSQIEQVLINIIKNAESALENKDIKKLTIEVKTSTSHTVIKITDNGKGIAADVIDKIFIPFFTTRKEGSGIGLTLSREIMQKHGGSIEVNSDASGTTFTLLFPLANQQQERIKI